METLKNIIITWNKKVSDNFKNTHFAWKKCEQVLNKHFWKIKKKKKNTHFITDLHLPSFNQCITELLW